MRSFVQMALCLAVGVALGFGIATARSRSIVSPPAAGVQQSLTLVPQEPPPQIVAVSTRDDCEEEGTVVSADAEEPAQRGTTIITPDDDPTPRPEAAPEGLGEMDRPAISPFAALFGPDPEEVNAQKLLAKSALKVVRTAVSPPNPITGAGIPDAAWDSGVDLAADVIYIAMFLMSDDLEVEVPGDEPEKPEAFQPAARVTGLPEGMALTGCARWSSVMSFDVHGGLQPPELQIRLALTGGEASRIARTGMYWIDKLAGVDGAAANLFDHDGSSNDNPFMTTVRVQRDRFDSMDSNGHPRDGVHIVFPIGRFEEPPTTIRQVRGSLRIQVPTVSKRIVIPNVLSLVGKHIDDPDLEQSRLRFTISRDASESSPIELRLVAGDYRLVGDIIPIDRDGKPLPASGFHSSLDFMHFVDWRVGDRSTDDSNYPPDMGLQITVFSALCDSSIEFEFTDLEVPSPPNRHGNSVIQLAPPPQPAVAPARRSLIAPASDDPRVERVK